MADVTTTTIGARPMTAALAVRRPSTPARREVLREFRDQVAEGTYEPPVEALSAELAAWLLYDGLPDRERA